WNARRPAMVSFAPVHCAPDLPGAQQRMPAHALRQERSMSITRDSVVSIHYTLKNASGEVIDSSAGGEPLAYLHGHGNLIPGLERELTGKKPGDKLQVTVPPAEGYGEYDPQLVQRVPRRALKGIAEVRVGMRLQTQDEHGPRAVTVTQLTGDM